MPLKCNLCGALGHNTANCNNHKHVDKAHKLFKFCRCLCLCLKELLALQRLYLAHRDLAREAVRKSITTNIEAREPLVKTLNKYVKLVRSEHCFLLFEELGKTDKWLQCLEVWHDRNQFLYAGKASCVSMLVSKASAFLQTY